MFKTVLIVGGVFIGMGAASLGDPVPLGMEVRAGDGTLIGRVSGFERDDQGRPRVVTIAAVQAGEAAREGKSAAPDDESTEDDAPVRRRSISIERFLQALPIWE
jgi:hypothetical protein